MMRRFISPALHRLVIATFATALCIQPLAAAKDDTFMFSNNDITYYSTEAQGVCSAPSSSTSGGSSTLSSNVPEPWRTLINNAASKYPNVDSRLVAATLWIENRGWPDPNKQWADSGAGAQGPWQFIPSTWASMGTDGDGDGVKDPKNPADAVHAAFKHQEGSAGKPILTGATGDAQKDYDTVAFNRDRTNLMSFLASYNGSGAPNGVPIAQMPNNENSNYLRMGYWLLASDFEKAPQNGTGDFIDARTSGALAGGNITTPGTTTTGSNQTCASLLGNGVVNSAGYSFPLLVAKNDVTNNQGKWPCPGTCHHDGTPAFDLFKGSFPPGQEATAGTKVVAIENGTIFRLDNVYQGISGCQSILFQGTSGHGYWMGHMAKATVTTGQSVKAGEVIAEVGSSRCTGNNSPAHLHIDMTTSSAISDIGSQAKRSQDLVTLINQLYEELP